MEKIYFLGYIKKCDPARVCDVAVKKPVVYVCTRTYQKIEN